MELVISALVGGGLVYAVMREKLDDSREETRMVRAEMHSVKIGLKRANAGRRPTN